jgi:hypothetical protein
LPSLAELAARNCGIDFRRRRTAHHQVEHSGDVFGSSVLVLKPHGNLVDLIETDSTGSIELNRDTWKGPTYRRVNLLLGTARIDVTRHLARDVDGPVAFRGHLRFPLFPLIMSS